LRARIHVIGNVYAQWQDAGAQGLGRGPVRGPGRRL